MTALPLFARHYTRRRLRGDKVVVVSPDLGRVKAARRFARMLDAALAIVTKVRPGHEQAVAAEVIGDVRGKRVVIGDDMIVSGGTLAAAATALLEAGAQDVRAFATHALLTPDARRHPRPSPARRDRGHGHGRARRSSAPTAPCRGHRRRPPGGHDPAVFESKSVSAVFAGENELF